MTTTASVEDRGVEKGMTQIYNRKKDQEKRRFLRKNMTKATSPESPPY
jgi:hypothetical protein